MKKYTILSIDGGGRRGLLPSIWIEFLESKLGFPIQKNIDLFAGTSTGSIVAAALAKKNPVPAKELVFLYKEKVGSIFKKTFFSFFNPLYSLFNPKYDSNNLRKELETYLGNERMANTQTDLVVCAYDSERRCNLLFSNYIAKKSLNWNVPIIEAVISSSSAPTYFKPNKFVNGGVTFVGIDGGIAGLNNPSLMAVLELLGRGILPSQIQLISFGTGTQQTPQFFEKTKDKGAIGLVGNIVENLMDGASEATDLAVRTLLGKENYIRLQVNLDEFTKEMDNTDPKVTVMLENLAHDSIQNEHEKFETILKWLS